MWDGLRIAASSVGILLVSVFLHELGHYFAAVRLGGGGTDVVLGPFGGLSAMRPPHDPLSEAGMHLAGPCVNLGLAFVTGAAVLALGGDPIPLLNPLMPRNLVEYETAWQLACKLTCWINWVLVLINLLPVFPFDGGRALRAALMKVWPDRRAGKASLVVETIAKVTAAVLLIAAIALMVHETPQKPPIPAWFPLLLLAMFLYFSAKQESERSEELSSPDEPFAYDFSQGYTSLEEHQDRTSDPAGPVQRWLAMRKQARLQRQREVEAEEEARVDDILSRLHQHGIDSLSQEDRSLLDRVSARYRRERL
jgi:Zn-dependent protease